MDESPGIAPPICSIDDATVISCQASNAACAK
jgi:hypothetical protein